MGKDTKLKSFIKTTIREFLNEQKESNLPNFTQETGITKITTVDDLTSLIKSTIPEKYYNIKYNELLKYFEIKKQDFHQQDSGSVRVGGENGKIKFYIHDTSEGDSREKLFDYHEISDMKEYLEKIVSYQLPSIGLK